MPTTTVEKIKKTETSKDKKFELILDSLEVKDYRCFEHLTIEKLGRVNLIVGKNNVGKTALLEALWIYANKGYQSASYFSLFNRDEFPSQNQLLSHRGMNQMPQESYRAIKNLFFGRPDLDSNSANAQFSVGKIENPIKLREPFGDNSTIEYEAMKNQVKVIVTRSNQSIPRIHESVPQLGEVVGESVRNFNSYFIRTSMLENQDLVEMWDEVEQKVLEDSVIDSLQIIDSNLLDIRFSGYLNRTNNRVPVARLKNVSERVPLKSLGEGMSHLLAVALALVKCKDGMLLIDEIESGLHYSVLPDVWKLIFKTAKDLNVQVFATTHSKDCIEAFTQAAIDDKESDGVLIRLERHAEKIVAKTISEERLAQAVDHDVEVR